VSAKYQASHINCHSCDVGTIVFFVHGEVEEVHIRYLAELITVPLT